MDALVETLFACIKYNKPATSSPTLIVLQLCKLCIKQYPTRNIRQQFKDLMSLVVEIRLKMKEGTHKTSIKVRVFEIVIVLMCVTLAIEQFGSLTWVDTITIMVISIEEQLIM